MVLLVTGMPRLPSAIFMYGVCTGVTGQNIPLAEIYPGILWPRPIYTLGYSMA